MMKLEIAPGSCPAGLCFFGWRPLPSLTDDENLVDLSLMVARNSRCKEGHMGALLCRPPPPAAVAAGGAAARTWTLVAAGTNAPLFYGPGDPESAHSDTHAEVAVLGGCAARTTKHCRPASQ